ncbi:MAG: flagellar type III secretion system pore protein FliP [Alphaproteobacteria bacterium]|nr:flagellar type III secretion system pore protein FliP [Alphaproteobacteria bacterium]MCL2506022.1 flagellar type III secretion system pore protein FliP [Alphaproteobacteria bacterium]
MSIKQLALSLLIGTVAFLYADAAFAQSVTFDVGGGSQATSKIIQTVILITVLSLAPSILIMVTSYTRIIVVLSFLRTALGLQTTPPNVVLISLALFLTMFIMQPTFERAWDNGIKPFIDDTISQADAFEKTMGPIKEFMLANTREKDLQLFVDVSAKASEMASNTKTEEESTAPPLPSAETDADTAAPEALSLSPRIVIPAFMLSELRRAFEIGFLIFLPFLIIDIVIASLLMSMGMMMLPPSLVSLPFKIVFFVLVDGWYLVCGSLIQSYTSS